MKIRDDLDLTAMVVDGPAGEPVFSLTKLSKRIGRPKYSIEILNRDPFSAIDEPARVRDAEWLTALWRQYCIKPGAHLRRVHYVLISQAAAILMPNSQPYQNDDKSFVLLNTASVDARYLHLIPAADLVDRRNNPPIIYLPNDGSDPEVKVTAPPRIDMRNLKHVLKLMLELPKILQRYHLEVWCEKTSMNDILLPICERYGVNLITGMGEQSLTACVNVVKRALANGNRPVRVLYISDFDPGGKSMPVAVARKIEFEIYDGGHDLDLQVRPILLDKEQVLHYHLLPIPMKEGERRAEKFMERYGVEGATELDALEALHPGEFERIVTREIERYIDHTLDTRVDAAVEEMQGEIDGINVEVRQRHAVDIKRLKAAHKKLAIAVRAYEKLARPIFGGIAHDLKTAIPELASYEWPTPALGDEDLDPMFDSTRTFLEQTDRYKRHQKKEISRTRKLMKREKAICIVCKKPFEKTSRNKFGTCTDPECHRERMRAQAEGRPIRPRTPNDEPKRRRRKSIQQTPATCVVCQGTFMVSGRNKTGTCAWQFCKNEARARREALANGVVREDRWPPRPPVTIDSPAVDL